MEKVDKNVTIDHWTDEELSDEERTALRHDPRRELWCSDHRCWRTKCQPVHAEFSRRLRQAREQFKDVG